MKKIFLFIAVISQFYLYGQKVPIPEMDEKDTAALVKASYVYNIAKLIDWPDEYKTGNFIISVMGSSNLHKELVKEYNSKRIGSQQIEIRKLSETLNINKCHILYVGREAMGLLEEISKSLKDRPTFIITDGKDALEKGSALNFEFINGQWRYSLKLANATEKGLFIGSTLKSLAIKVE